MTKLWKTNEMWVARKAAWLAGKRYWTKKKVPASLGTRPGNQKHPWKVQLVSLNFSWDETGDILRYYWISAKNSKKCNNFQMWKQSGKIKLVWKNGKHQHLLAVMGENRNQEHLLAAWCGGVPRPLMSQGYYKDIKKVSPRTSHAACSFPFLCRLKFRQALYNTLGSRRGLLADSRFWCGLSLKSDTVCCHIDTT